MYYYNRNIYWENPTTGNTELVENEIVEYLDAAGWKLGKLIEKKPIFASYRAKMIKEIDDVEIFRKYFRGKSWNIENGYVFDIKGKQFLLVLKYNYRSYNDNYSIDWRVWRGENPTRKASPSTNYAPLKYYRQEAKRNPRNSCQIQSLTELTGDKFDNVLELMEYGGWTEANAGHVAYGDRWNDLLACYGLKKTLIFSKWRSNTKEIPECWENSFKKRGKTMLVNTAAKQLKKGKFAITIRGHVLTVIDGVIYDNSDNRKAKVLKIFEIKEQ